MNKLVWLHFTEEQLVGQGTFSTVEAGTVTLSYVIKPAKLQEEEALQAILYLPSSPQDLHLLKRKYVRKKILFDKDMPDHVIKEIAFHRYFDAKISAGIACLYQVDLFQNGVGLILEHAGTPLSKIKSDVAADYSLAIVYQLVKTLQVIHQAEWAHRDLKPDNILVEVDNSIIQVKLCDFGSAKPIGVNGSEDGHTPVACTLEYRAPEVLLLCTDQPATYTTKMDMWSLGVILYELLFQTEFINYTKLSPKSRSYVSPDLSQNIFNLIVNKVQHLNNEHVVALLGPTIHDILTGLLQIDPIKRYSCEQVMALMTPQSCIAHLIYPLITSTTSSLFLVPTVKILSAPLLELPDLPKNIRSVTNDLMLNLMRRYVGGLVNPDQFIQDPIKLRKLQETCLYLASGLHEINMPDVNVNLDKLYGLLFHLEGVIVQ